MILSRLPLGSRCDLPISFIRLRAVSQDCPILNLVTIPN
nr:MAG TPA: hypothetical protein [Caudoviricetes sp.]